MPCNSSVPCRIPPHPDAVAKIKEQRKKAIKEGRDLSEIPDLCGDGAATGKYPGINGSFIFPPSRFPAGASPAVMRAAVQKRAPLRGQIRLLLILVDFDDQVMVPGVEKRFKELFFSHGVIPTGSVTEFYEDVSGGKISIGGEVVGPFRMPRDIKEYAHNGFGFEGKNGDVVEPPNLQTLAHDAAEALRGKLDFRVYDNDGNGQVDGFVVVHAGAGAEENPWSRDLLWSLQWNLTEPLSINGSNIYAFLTIPETAQLGVCVHELGHLLFGWPDLYDGDSSSAGIGRWCLMGTGSWNGPPGQAGAKPAHPSAWCKAQQGWVDTVLERVNHEITVMDVKTPASHKVHHLWTNGDPSSSEYFLIENRQQVGFDQYIPGNGLLVWHIDENVGDNTNEKHPKVGLMQADGLNQLAKRTAAGDSGDPFPGATLNRTFNATSTPNSHSYSEKDTMVSITNISPSNNLMTMNVTVRS